MKAHIDPSSASKLSRASALHTASMDGASSKGPADKLPDEVERLKLQDDVERRGSLSKAKTESIVSLSASPASHTGTDIEWLGTWAQKSL